MKRRIALLLLVLAPALSGCAGWEVDCSHAVGGTKEVCGLVNSTTGEWFVGQVVFTVEEQP